MAWRKWSSRAHLAVLVEALRCEAFVLSPVSLRDRMPRKFDFAAQDLGNRNRAGQGSSR